MAEQRHQSKITHPQPIDAGEISRIGEMAVGHPMIGKQAPYLGLQPVLPDDGILERLAIRSRDSREVADRSRQMGEAGDEAVMIGGWPSMKARAAD